MDYLDPRDMDDSYSFPARFSANISAYELSALEAAADEGNIDSCVELAVYFHDLRVHDKSFAYALKAASSGHCEFQEWVASCYERGLGVTADIQEAIRWAKCAASQGSMSGAVKYARLARSVISKNKDNSLLGDLESVLSRDNLSKSMIVKYELAGAHLDARENEKGIELLKQVVEKKGDLEREYYARAAHRLAQYYLYELSNADSVSGLKFMRIAADNGYSKAQVTYANLIVDSQPQEAKKYYEMATNSDDAYAHAILGKHYYLGTFGKKGKELAKYHLLLARRIGLEEKMLQAVNDLLEHL